MTTNKIKELVKMFTFLSRFSKLLKQRLEKKKMTTNWLYFKI